MTRTISEATTRRADRVTLDDDARRQAERHCTQTRQPRLFDALPVGDLVQPLPGTVGSFEWLRDMVNEHGHCGQ